MPARPAGAGRLTFAFDLTLSASAAGRLARLPALAALKPRRARATPHRILWHDGPDATLAGQGLALSEHAGTWRLERLVPEADTPFWPPGTIPPLLAEANSPASLAWSLPARLTPCAAFDGRRIVLHLAPPAPDDAPAEPLTLTLLHGVLRTVTGDNAVLRLLLDGPVALTACLVLDLAAEIDLAVPCATLAAQALAAAGGHAVPARRLGPPLLRQGLSIAEAFAAVTGHLADVILYWAARTGETDPEPVHQTRVAVRRLRSAMALFRAAVDCPWWQEARAGLKTLSDLLGPARDWDVFTTGTARRVASAFPDERAIARLRAAAERRRAASYAALREFLTGAGYRRLCLVLLCLSVPEAWQPHISEEQRIMLAGSLDDFARDRLDHRLKQVRRAGDAIETLPPEALHQLRLCGKRLRYAAEIFAPLFAGRAAAHFIHRLTRLQEQLGTLNDDAVASTLLRDLGGPAAERGFAIGLVRGFLAASQTESRSAMLRAWKKFRRREPFWR